MVKLVFWLTVIVLVPTALSLGAAQLFRIRQSAWVLSIASFLLPAAAFFGGLALLIMFLAHVESQPPGTNNGGDGPAFFGILWMTLFLPVLLLGPGLISGFLARFLFARMMRKEGEPNG